MNERFLFRAWDKNGKGFINGFNMYGFSTGQGAPVKKLQRFSSEWNMDDVVLMQCIGLKDINEKLIFEGDIIKRETFGSSVIGEVVWADMGFTGFELKVVQDDGIHFYSMGRGQYDDDEDNICNDEVIGNMYKNPELLNG